MLTYKPVNFDADMPQILALTRDHLDEGFSEAFFRWKHLENPFGVSFAMAAWDLDKLVGLRLFMRWEFIGPNNKIVKAIRPVDTVTHTDYRGKGIFKTLTLQGLELDADNYEMVFNTPNQNSLPGYLKMGWQKINLPGNFVYAIANPFLGNKKEVVFSLDGLPKTNSSCQTNINIPYLKWRYQDFSFRFASLSDDALVVYKIGKIKGVKALIIYEVLGKNEAVATIISAISSKSKTILCFGYFGDKIKAMPFIKTFKRNKPIVVWRDDKYGIHDNITFSLGDLEGKL